MWTHVEILYHTFLISGQFWQTTGYCDDWCVNTYRLCILHDVANSENFRFYHDIQHQRLVTCLLNDRKCMSKMHLFSGKSAHVFIMYEEGIQSWGQGQVSAMHVLCLQAVNRNYKTIYFGGMPSYRKCVDKKHRQSPCKYQTQISWSIYLRRFRYCWHMFIGGQSSSIMQQT